MTLDIKSFLEKHQLGQGFADTAQQWFIPFAEQIIAHQNGAEKPFFLGLNGCQGSGKSTFTDFLHDYLHQTHGKRVVCLSLDDFYLDQKTRRKLAEAVHPLLATRGVPGTHDTVAIARCLKELAQGLHTTIPRFDKATDNPKPRSLWTTINQKVDVVIFEGWCWGVSAQDETQLADPVNGLERQEDPLGHWRKYVNAQLAECYLPLYGFMDCWCMLKAPDFKCVFQWRLEQEQKLAAATRRIEQSSGIMDEDQVARFIQHYQRLTEHALATLPTQCDVVFELNANRRILGQQGGAQ